MAKAPFEATVRDGRPRCQEEIMRYIGNWPHSGQCSRAAAPESDRCQQHHPDAIEARLQAANKKENESWQVRRKEISGKRFYAVLEKIAAGHNDARGLAQETLDNFNKKTVFRSGVRDETS